jgi:hypothetical protein
MTGEIGVFLTSVEIFLLYTRPWGTLTLDSPCNRAPGSIKMTTHRHLVTSFTYVTARATSFSAGLFGIKPQRQFYVTSFTSLYTATCKGEYLTSSWISKTVICACAHMSVGTAHELWRKRMYQIELSVLKHGFLCSGRCKLQKTAKWGRQCTYNITLWHVRTCLYLTGYRNSVKHTLP